MSSCCHKHSLPRTSSSAPFTARIFASVQFKKLSKTFYFHSSNVNNGTALRSLFRRHFNTLPHRSLAANAQRRNENRMKEVKKAQTFFPFFCHSNIISEFGIHRRCRCDAEHQSERLQKFRISSALFLFGGEKPSSFWYALILGNPHLLCIS